MKTIDFAQCLASYLTMYLPRQLGLSENTIMAYWDSNGWSRSVDAVQLPATSVWLR